ncbi:hypothetical protein [Burkholderia ubonensis]|uniref:hypothetical protein n=1 Tax=Burkholderia ubonensis TaxID=101571 RepID=UPI0018DF9DEB|nr:hypothetical protein [Burkholderia ubonensis]
MVAKLSARFRNKMESTQDALFDNARRRDALIMLHIRDDDDIPSAKSIVARALHDKIELMLEGSPDKLLRLKPDNQTVWTSGDILFISNRSDRRGLYFGSGSPEFGADKLATYIIDTRKALLGERSTLAIRSERTDIPTLRSDVQSWKVDLPSLSTQSPSEVCLRIRNELARSVPRGELSDVVIQQAVEKVCQYGTLSDFSAVPGDKSVPGYSYNSNVLVNLKQEWLYLVSGDPYQPSGSRAYLWTKTYGEGAGSGFTRINGDEGYFTRNDALGLARNIMHPLIHSGWGPVINPLGSLVNLVRNGSNINWDNAWVDGKPSSLFICESDNRVSFNVAGKVIGCPIGPRLLSLLPADSFSGDVNVARSVGWNISGTLTGGIAGGQNIVPSVSLALSGGYSETTTNSVTMKLLHVQSNANTTYYRSTGWVPNWSGMLDWSRSTGSLSLVAATPLATTINPQYSTVWEIPLVQNAGRTLQFSSIYEARYQNCLYAHIKTDRCVTSPHRPWDSRMVWLRGTDLLLSM